MYNLPSEVTPCLNKKKNEGALQFLLYKRYIERSFGEFIVCSLKSKVKDYYRIIQIWSIFQCEV